MDPEVVAAIVMGVATVIAAVIGLWRYFATRKPNSSVQTGPIQSGGAVIVSGRDTRISRSKVHVQTGSTQIAPEEDSVEVPINRVQLERAKLDWSPKETIRGVLVSPTTVLFQRRDQQRKRTQPIVIDFTIEEHDQPSNQVTGSI